MSKRVKSFSQTPMSTPRRHSRGSPIAHRNFGTISLQTTPRRIEQVLSFPPEFDIEQFRQQSDAFEYPVRNEPPAIMSNSSEDIPTKLSPTDNHLNRSSSCPSLVLPTLFVAPSKSLGPLSQTSCPDVSKTPQPEAPLLCSTPISPAKDCTVSSPHDNCQPHAASPDILEMVLGGDISIPNVPEIIDLTNAWGSNNRLSTHACLSAAYIRPSRSWQTISQIFQQNCCLPIL
ncbi:hypothetical protein TNIN_354011 [Trichonephila inaurata madagascariensis]|uniref:Uncharacterized protein n=1 Tax=Trichonephila inaurata madagascariensis TaxID=2747483 RepID=A0A8X7C4H7_9ARAC|nr:hypothetical protein TNIN_354011 [Trichonephila inaurata madagascariensis]